MRALLLFPLLLLITQPSMAIRQGTTTADLFIRHYERSNDFGRLALWHEAAAACLKYISVPMNEIAYDYYKQHGYEKWVARQKKETREIQEQYAYHRKHAETAWQRFAGGVCNPASLSQRFAGRVRNPASLSQRFAGRVRNPDAFALLNTERENIAKFIATWLPHYPNRFYEFGIYPTFFRKQRELAEQQDNYIKVLLLEADAAEMCATQYEKILIAYGRTEYEKHRDAYRQHASQLRDLAQQNPKTLPPEVNSGKQILDSLTIQTVSPQQIADVTLQIAKSNPRVQAALAGQNGVHAYPSFHGFAWIVRFANHSHGNIVTAIIDKKTAEVLDVF